MEACVRAAFAPPKTPDGGCDDVARLLPRRTLVLGAAVYVAVGVAASFVRKDEQRSMPDGAPGKGADAAVVDRAECCERWLRARERRGDDVRLEEVAAARPQPGRPGASERGPKRPLAVVGRPARAGTLEPDDAGA